MSKTMKTFTTFAVFLLLGFSLYNQKDPDPQRIDATRIPASMDILKYQAPSVHDRASDLAVPIWSESFDNVTFPPTGWLNVQISGIGLWTRATTTTYPSGFSPHSGAGLARFNSYTYSTGVSASLISSVFSLTSGPAKLGFWMLRDAGFSTSADKVEYMINTTASTTGATLLLTVNRSKTLAPVETGADGWYYYEIAIPPAFNTATNYIVMKATSAYGNDIYVDDVAVNPLLLHDVGTMSVDVSSPQMPGSIIPKATVKNFGSSVETFPVTMSITPGSYTSTMNVTSLASGSTNQVTFGNWAATAGTYTVKVITQAATDLDRTNDTLTKTVVISAAVWTAGAPITAGSYLGTGVGYTKSGSDTTWLFALGGNAPNTNAVYKYNVRTNTWSTCASLPVARVVLGSAIVRDTLYAIAGSDGTNYSNTLYKYNINANTWSTGTVLPTATLGWCKGAGYQDSLLYVAGGANQAGAAQNFVFMYNTITGVWKTCTVLPSICFGGGFAITGNTMVYVGGIQGAAPGSATFEGAISQSDRSVITWTTGTPYPGGTMWKTDMAPWWSNEVIMATGTTGTTSGTWWTPAIPNPCYSYNPSTNVWSPKPNLTTPVLGAYLGSVQTGPAVYKLIVASGYTGAVATNTQIYIEDFTGVTTGTTEIPEDYSVSQNYPNPFNPTTKIDYNIKSNGFVSLKIYSVLGEEVATIVDGFKSAGTYTVIFNASQLSSGIYFYTLRSGDFTGTKKMILVK